MNCPFCQSDNIMAFNEEDKGITWCCEDCGGSFQVVQEPQDFPEE